MMSNPLTVAVFPNGIFPFHPSRFDVVLSNLTFGNIHGTISSGLVRGMRQSGCSSGFGEPSAMALIWVWRLRV